MKTILAMRQERTDFTGIRRHGAGWRATVSAGRGRSVQRHFPLDTSAAVMQTWRADTKAELRVTRKQRATAGTFEHDARRYLEAIKAMPTYETRKVDIHRWIAIFGTTRRDAITPAMIRVWRDRWMREPRIDHPPPAGVAKRPRRRVKPDPLKDEPYSASTINHWLRALSNIWTVLDGRRAPNPVRDVPEVHEPDALPRAIDYATIERIIAAVSDRGRPKKGEKNTSVALTKIRLRVIAFTGLTASQLGRLTRSSVNFEAATMTVTRRRKGRGAKPNTLPLLTEAVDAFKALDAANGWGPFSPASVRKSWVLALSKVRKEIENEGGTLPALRPTDLRHSMATLVFRATGDLRSVGELLQHTNARTTQRYALAAASDVLKATLAKVQTAPASGQKTTPDANTP